MADKEKMIIESPSSTLIKTVFVTPNIFEEIMKIPPERGEPIFIDLVKNKIETPHWKTVEQK